MEFSTRLVAIAAEFNMLPAALDDKKNRELFNALSESHGLSSYNTINDNLIQMTGKKPPVSYHLAPDRMMIAYEFCEKTIDYYKGMIKDFMNTFYRKTGTPLFLAHNISIRKIFNPGAGDGRAYLINKVFSITDANLREFQRPLHMMGTHIFFPGVEGGDLTAYDVKIESAMDDFRNIVVDSKAIFPLPIDMRKGNNIEQSVDSAEKFVDNNIYKFLQSFSR